MSEEINPQTDSQISAVDPNFIIESAKSTSKSNRTKYVVIAGSVIAFVCFSCLCGLLVLTFFQWNGGSLFNFSKEEAQIEKRVDEFMQAMKAKDIEAAYKMFSPRGQKFASQKDLAKMIEGNNYVLFDGYQKNKVLFANMMTGVNTNPDAPQGRYAAIVGQIEYTGGITGTYNAILEPVTTTWKFYGFHITVPPSKLDKR